jgi:hypothetical protein
MEKKFALAIWYVDHGSAWLDLKILAMTVRALLGGEGVAAPAHVSAPEFQRNIKDMVSETL